MAPRTLASTWRSFEKLARRYESAEDHQEDVAEELDVLAQKANRSRIVDALASVFVHSYQGLEETRVRFATSVNGSRHYPDWATAYSEEDDTIMVNPVGVLRFQRECREALDALKTPVARTSFQTYRYHAYLAQLRKLPARHMLFIQLLKEVARARSITTVEKKGGGTDGPEDERYMVLLWAFKELEALMAESSGTNLRSEYRIRWYESDWVVGKGR